MTTDRLNKALEAWRDAALLRMAQHKLLGSEAVLLKSMREEPTAEPTPCGHKWKANLTTTDGVPDAPVSWSCEWCSDGWIGESPPTAGPPVLQSDADYKTDTKTNCEPEPDMTRQEYHRSIGLPIVPTRSPQVRAADLDTVEPEPRFKVGDRVQHALPGVREQGTVAQTLAATSYRCQVDWDDRGLVNGSVRESELEPAPATVIDALAREVSEALDRKWECYHAYNDAVKAYAAAVAAEKGE
jgi:hypothetical protein